MELILQSLLGVVTVPSLVLIFIGVCLGIVFGSIPGLTAAMAVALCLPITFGMPAMLSISLLIGLYIGGISGGLISAIMLSIPGTPASIATTFDGAPMAKRGESSRALSIAVISSFLGGLFSIIILIFISPYLAKIAISFTPFDYFSVILFSLTLMASLSGGSLKKGLIAGFLGIAFSFVGADPISGYSRFTLGIHDLDGGLTLLPVVVGLFAVAEIIKEAEKVYDLKESKMKVNSLGNTKFKLSDFKGQWGNFFRSSIIGTAIGILPGIGGGVSNLIAYTTAKERSKKPEQFGTGCVDGIIASEAANNASIGGAMIPLLTVGIPGDAITAMLIGGFMIHGISPGPLMFIQEKEMIYGIFGSLIVANIFMLIVMLVAMKYFIKVLSAPKSILLPIIISICIVGAYAANNRVFDIFVVVAFGVIGYIMSKFKYPVVPMVMGIILGPMLEVNLRRALMYSNGSIVPFFTKPISVIFIIATLFSIYFISKKSTKEERNTNE